MIRFALSLGAVLLAMGILNAASADPTTAPALVTTRQLIVDPNPGTYASALVLPFTPVSGDSEWIGKGIQEDLATELVRQSRLNVLTPANVGPAADAVEAARIGHERNVSLVAFGTYQVLDSEVRINGQLVDVNAGRAVAALKATGPRRDLFHMEDLLAAQAVSALPPNQIKVGAGAYAADATAARTVQPDNSTEQYNTQGYYVTPGPDMGPTYTPVPATPVVPYDYGYYPPYNPGYDYPFWNSGFVFLGGFDGHGFGHGHEGGHEHGEHGFGSIGLGTSGGFGGGFHGTAGGFHGAAGHR